MAVKTIIDLNQVRANQRRAAAIGAEGADFLFRSVADDLALRLSAVKRQFERGILFAPAAVPDEALPGLLATERHVLPEDAAGEALGLKPERYDLAVSLLTLHETNDTPGILAQIRRALKPDGLFLACVPGGNTLGELRESLLAAEAELTGAANARVLPFMDVRDAGGLLQRAGFALPVIDQDRRTVRYDSAFALMRDLRATGDTSVLIERDRRPLRRSVLMRMAEVYAERFADADGRIRATFDIISLSGWVPHESQQKPLRPGGAKTRLADALGTVERSAGEKPGD